MSNPLLGVDAFHIPRLLPSSGEKETEDHSTNNKTPQSSVILVYEAIVAELSRHITVTWNKSLINYSLTVSVENLSNNENYYNCKIDLKTGQFWGKKGVKSFQVDGRRVEVYWDFRHAKFSSNPEPSADYYVALVYEEEVILILGDLKKDAYKRTKKRPAFEEPILLCKKENVYGKKIFCTKAVLHNDEKEHDIVIEMSSGFGDPELWISIDNYEAIHVMNLHWRFRGNEKVIMKNNFMIEIFWDVHDWLFNNSLASTSTGTRGLFIFKSIDEPISNTNLDRVGKHHDKTGFKCDSPPELSSPISGFFHVVYAWKFE